ncbi:MAG: hypothetical protein Q9169_006008 [Polycauliona sp. 2 TL-2023]
MLPIPELSCNQVSFKPLSGFPFDSPAYNPSKASGLRCTQFLDDIRLADQSCVSYFELLNGEGFFIPQHGVRYRRAYNISRPAFEKLSRELLIPIQFFEVLANNNGCYQAYTSFNENQAEFFRECKPSCPGHLPRFLSQRRGVDLLVKLPSSFLNSAIYFRHDLVKETTVCVLFGNEIHRVKSALGQMFLPSLPSSASPMQILNIVVSEYVAILEPERHALDVQLRQLEAKTGMGAHVFDESQRATANELNDLSRALHLCEGQLAFFERTVQFQVGWIEFLQAQHFILNRLRFGTGEILELPHVHRPLEEEVKASLSLRASLSRESLEQVRTLRNRVRIQLSVVSHGTSNIPWL